MPVGWDATTRYMCRSVDPVSGEGCLRFRHDYTGFCVGLTRIWIDNALYPWKP
jgi:hypothetical protein